jgi:hypothetical protein
MKVKIGPYLNWWGPYQIADLLFANPDKYVSEDQRGWRHRGSELLGDWLANTRFADLCQWIQDKRKRRVYVHIDNYDVWGADHTMSLIALPLLQKLKVCKHGSPSVDDEDVPAGLGLRSTEAPAKENDWDTDANFHSRWEWVLDEIIWAHYQEALSDPDEAACWQHDLPDANWPYPNTATGIELMLGNIKCDEVALAAFQARKQNGFRLFGKYYQALWD